MKYMELKYYMLAYIAFTTVIIAIQIYETIRREKEIIRQGGEPLGDSTYIIYVTSWLFRVLIAVTLYFTVGVFTVPQMNGFLLFLALLVGTLLLELVSATLDALVMFIIKQVHIRVVRKKLNEKADEYNQALIKKQEREN